MASASSHRLPVGAVGVRRRPPGAPLAVWAAVVLFASSAAAQVGPGDAVHYRHSGRLPPGEVGREMLARSVTLRGYFQPVEIQAPPGASIALVIDGRFERPQPAPVRAGMLIGQVYRFRVTGIPGNEGFEVYPTIEVINRLYPPPGEAQRFPIPVQLTRHELEMALDGRFVTRVIYLEDPDTALPRREEVGFQRYFEVAASQDPLKVADELGRPMAILRMGSRIPDAQQLAREFAYGSPPLIKIAAPPPADDAPVEPPEDAPLPKTDEAAFHAPPADAVPPQFSADTTNKTMTTNATATKTAPATAYHARPHLAARLFAYPDTTQAEAN